MNKRNLWTRAMAFALAVVMILTSQTVSSMGGTLGLNESQQQEVLSGEDAQEQDNVQSGNAYDEEGLTEENSVSDSQENTGDELDTAAQPSAEELAEQESAGQETVQPVDLRDETTSIRVTGGSGALPADADMTAEPLAGDELPAGAADAVDAALEEENLTVQDRAFYDISMNGIQPSGTVRVWLPIPDEWDGVLDAWYIDGEGHVQNLDAQDYNAEEKREEGRRYYVFDTDHFSIYGVTVSQEKALTVSISSNRESAFPGDQVTLNSAVSEEGAALQWQYKTTDGDWQNIEGANSSSYSFTYSEENGEYEYRLQAALGDQVVYSDSLKVTRRLTLRETVELYYGKNGTQDTADVSVRLEEAGTSFKAGDTVTMMISYQLQAAALYNYGDQAVPMFDTYNDTKILFKIPAGMSLSLDATAPLDNVRLEGPTKDNVYTFELNDSINASSDGAGSFLVNVNIKDNGKLEANHIFNFGETEDFLKIETKFDINGAEDDWPEDLKEVTKVVPTESNAPVVTSATDDEWMVQKTADGFTVSEDRSTVTVHYNLAVGLKGADGQIVSNPQTYGRIGRVPFDGDVVLRDVPTVSDRQGATIQYEEITIKTSDGEVVQASDDGTYTLPIETCGSHKVDGVDADAPYYSTYTVDVVYPAEKFIVKYSDADQSELTVNNSADISYRLKGIDEDKTSHSDADQKVREIIEPAKLTISKYIVDYADGTSSLYTAADFPAGNPVSGPVSFKVADKDGNIPTLYRKNNDGTYTALAVTDGVVTIDPADTLDGNHVWNDGVIEVYLDAGTYVVSELATETNPLPSNTAKITAAENKDKNAEDKEVTIAEEGSGTADFYNRELLGSITVEKKGIRGGVESHLMGAEFGLYRDSECTDLIKKDTTDNQGNLTFGSLPYGTYYVKEITAPGGYIKDNTVHTVTLADDKAKQTVNSVNRFNNAYVKLQKQVFDIAEGDFVNVGTSNYGIFAGSFTIQRRTSSGSWDNPENIESGISLGQDGAITRSLPAYAENGEAYYYRFAEKLPEGWHGTGETDPDASGNRYLYSKEFTLTEDIGNSLSGAHLIEMQNWRNGSIDLTKRFWNADSGRMAVSSSDELTASFDLYYTEGKDSSDYHKYNEESYTVKAGGTVSITDLPRTTEADDEENAGGEYNRYYYLVETSSADGYALSEKSEGFEGTNSAEKTTINVDGQDLTAYGPFNFTDGTVQLQQSITLDNVEQKVPVVIEKVNSYTNGFVDGAEYEIYEYSESAEDHKGNLVVSSTAIPSEGDPAELEPAKKYIVIESKTPQGYEDVTGEEERIINLEEITTVDTDTETVTVTLKNRPDPKITIEKKLRASDGTETTASGVAFELYTKEGSTFEPALGDDGKQLILTPGSQLQLPADTYYLKETATAGVLDPSKHEDLYNGYKHEYSDGSYYFGPYTVENQQDVQDLGTIVNYSDKGEVCVTKYRMIEGGTKVALSGAEISIYREGEDTPLQTLTSAEETGYVIFRDLPIYDEEGEKITYIISETKAPDGYTKSEEKWKVQLSAGEQVTKDMYGANLELINQPETSLRVRKVFYNIWENQFTHKVYFLPGTEIALYRLNGNEYVYEGCQTTNSIGEVVFTGLTQKDEYVAVEVSIPGGEAYQYLEPAGKKDYLETENGVCPPTIRKEDINKYNIVTKSANTDENNPQTEEQTGTLTNVENWTQLRVEKFAIGDKGQADAGQKRKLNNAEFELYQQIVGPEDETALAFDSNDPDTTLVGSYTSGTLYDSDGKRKDGFFATDILKSADNVVYWLVEKTPGIGGKLKPENAITLIKRKGTEYTNNSTYEGTTCSSLKEYEDNKLTEFSVENDPAYDGDGERFSTVRIAKWAGSYTEDGVKVRTYTPLGNASFDLYLAAEDGTLVEKIDTLTTGLDNDLSAETGTSAPTAPVSALASSKAFSWTALTSKYEENLEMYNRIFYTDEESGNSYARVALVETDAPDGYTRSGTTYYMYMFFRYEKAAEEGKTQVTESFNDVFYVKNAEHNVTLAEEQDGIVWGLYATEENENGGYDPIAISGAPEGASQQQYRLVNWPVDNFAVTVTKYGYEPVEGETTGKTSEELDAHYSTGVHDDRVPLANVTMRLERLVDGRWTTYAYNTYSGLKTDGLFTTDRNGYFAFPRGLDIGQYRIVEVTPNAKYENIYDLETAGENSDYTGDAEHSQAAYYFDVAADNVDISMYNPKKLTLDIQKQGMENEELQGVTFTLTGQAGPISGSTGEDGKAHLTGIGNGTYKLTESVSAGHTNEYLKEYFKQTYDKEEYQKEYGKLNDLVNGDGIFFGYKTRQIQNEDGSYSVTVTEEVDISDYGIKTSEGINLTVQNPETQDLTITKIDKDTREKKLGAVFKIEYQRFPVFSGDVALSDSGWTESTATTGEDGLIKLTGQKPGVYKITEIGAPFGYDITDTEPRYVALTGGMDIGSVTVGGTPVIKDTDSGYNEAALTFADARQVKLTVNKEIAKGDLALTGSSTFTFRLYNEDKEEITYKTVSCTDGADGKAEFTGLSQGATYYLRETEIPTGYQLTAIKDGQGNPIIPDKDGYFAFTVPTTGSDLTFTAVNTYLYAELSILKVDGEDGEPLHKADFKVYDGAGGVPNLETALPVSGIEFTENNGVYTARIPLSGTGEHTFYIFEKTAPENYLKDENLYIRADLSPGEKITVSAEDWKKEWANNNDEMLKHYIFPNYKGAYVELVKYGNVREGNPTEDDLLSGVTLALYEKNGDSWIASGTQKTGENGLVRFTVEGGKTYAVAEPSMPVDTDDSWKELQGIWAEGEDTAARTETVEIDGQKVTLHMINGGKPLDAGITYRYNAYNTPYVEMEIRKQDALNPNAAAQPTATVSVYEIAEDAQVTDEFAASLEETGTPVLADIPVKAPGSSVNEDTGETEYYNYADKNTWTALGSSFLAGKTYLVVETSSSVSQIRDNSKVDWYQKVTIPAGTKEKTAVTLKNIEGSVALDLEKTAKDQTQESLFTQGADLEYTIRPTVGNTYPLDSFTLTDTGLTAYHKADNTNTYTLLDGSLDGKYSINEVIVGRAEHDVSGYLAEGTAPITAEVTFYGFNGETLGTVSKDVSTSAQTFTLAEAAPNAEAGTFTVRYYADDLDAAGYALGTDFSPGEITVKARVDQQAGGEGVQSIDMIRNSVSADVKYTPWTTNGQRDAQKSIPGSAAADVEFSPQDAAVVTVEKTADQENVALNSRMTYSITLRNAGDAAADMEDPFIVDLLPQGTTWVSGSEKEIETDSKTLAFSSSSSGRADGETAVYVNLDGSLKPGEYVTIKITVQVGEASAGYGTRIQNYVLAGSERRGAQSDTNPQAASFKNENRDWAQSMDRVLTSMEETRRDSFRKILEASGREDYGYISAGANANWTTSTDITLVKSGYGDRNQTAGFTSDQLSTVSNGGWMRYRLTATNTSSINAMTGISMVDILPKPGDYRTGTGALRDSQWGLNYGSIDSVSKLSLDGSSVPLAADTDYKVYYYRGNLDSEADYQRVYNDAKTLKFNPQEPLPAGWSADAPDPEEVDTSVRAFAVAFADTVSLVGQKEQGTEEAYQSVVVEYTAKVENFSIEELQENAYDNAVNSFACHYSQYTAKNPEPVAIEKVLGSNVVSNTILQEEVKVGGHIWIDKNADGQRQEDESIDNFAGVKRIEEMLGSVEISLYRHNNTTGSNDLVGTYDKAGDTSWLTEANYIFDRLDPAMLREDASDKDAYGEDGKTLNTAALKGTDPAAYMIEVRLPSEGASGKFAVTAEGETNGRSYHPDQIPAKEQTDSNFTEGANPTTSELFYLWPTDTDVTYDNTKDIGIIPLRDLEITKRAADGEQPAVEGAVFKIYGPFAENATEYDLSDANLVDTVTTGADGKAVAENLRWYQKYVIVETSASTGYIKDGAAALGGTGTNLTPITLGSGDPAWVLGVPDIEKTTSTDQVTVTNKRIVDIQLGAEKSLKRGSEEGASLDVADGAFTFYLKDDKGTVLQTKTNDADGRVAFEEITLEGVGTFTYYISEAVPTDAVENVKDGITYDPADHKIVVKTEWTANGLKATYQYEEDGAWSENAAGTTITNIYNAAGTWTPEGTKTLTGRDMAEDEIFYFAVIDKEGAVVSTGTASGGRDGQAVPIVFEPISYKLDDAGRTFAYTIKETDANGNDLPEGRQADGMTYDRDQVTVNVTVTDNGKGKLVPNAVYSGSGAVFENNYTPTPIDYTPAVKKILSGNPVVKDETFEFKIEKTSGPDVKFANETASVTYEQDGAATGEQTVPFGAITFDKKGTYVFKITETTQSGNNKIAYDNAEWTFTVVVTDDGNGRLDYGVPVYDSSNEDETETAQAVFRNNYTPEPAYQPLKVTKQVDGNERPADAEFKFTLTEKSATAEGGAVLPETRELTINVGKDQASNAGTFDRIKFNAAGTYVFTITEEQTGVPGYVYDTTTSRDVQVTVADEDGTLKVTEVQYLNSSAEDSAVFTNHYDPENAFYTPKVKKTLTVGSGSSLPQKVNFTFELTQIRTDESPEGGVVTADGDTPVGTQTVSTADMTGPGVIDNLFFNKLEFTKAGTYYFQITEQADTAGYKGFTYDGTAWTLTVVVNDNNGTLEIPEDGGITYTSDANPPADADQAEFGNSYASAPAVYTPRVKKTIDSIFVPEEKNFTFNITNTGTTDGVNMPENTSVTVSGAGEGIFGEIEFTKTGTYTFEISESDGKLPGYDYDEKNWTLTVVVGDSVAGEGDEAKGQLVVESFSYVQSVTNTPSDTEAEFTNTYTAEPDSITPQVEKVINGADYPQDNKKVFTFHLTADAENEAGGASLEAGDGALMTAVTGEGIGSFSDISFYKPGEYRFHISEDDSNKENGYTYDKHTWTLTVTVTDEDSELRAVGTYTQDDADPAVTNPEKAVFTNTYAITGSEELVIPVEKTVTGDVPFGRDQTFKFRLEQKNNDPVKAVLPDDTEIEIKGSGNSAFDAVTFEKAGVYNFVVTEVRGKTDGYSYDESIWNVKVTVKDVESVLTIDQVVYEKGGNTVEDAEGVSFENSYSTVETKYTPQAEKDVTGDRVTTDKEFTFTLEPDEEYEGVELTETEASVTGEGRTSFGEITFNKAGIYTFTIRETDGGQNGYTYDESPWKLTVQVDDVDHILTKTSIVYSREDGTESGECAVFTNAYDAKAVPFAPAVEKKVTGDVPEGKDQTFTFTMSAAEDNPEGAQMPDPAAAEVTGSGSAKFGEITFEQSGVYSFEIREENGGAPGYSYDGNVWTVTVNVEDNNGILEIADVVYTRAGEIVEGAVAAVFENNYDPAEVSYAPQVVKKITGDETPDDRTFYFSLKADEKNGEGAAISSDKAKVTGAGSTNFGEITFSRAGAYQFLITEGKGGEIGYTYDESQWTLTVTVTDENGALKVSSAVYEKNDTDDSSSTEAAEFINRYEAAKPAAAKTGDGMDAGRSAALMAGSAFLIGVVFCIRRKRRGSDR